MADVIEYKARARRLAAHLLAAHGVKLTHGHALDAVANEEGHRDWNVLLALARRTDDAKPAATAMWPERPGMPQDLKSAAEQMFSVAERHGADEMRVRVRQCRLSITIPTSASGPYEGKDATYEVQVPRGREDAFAAVLLGHDAASELDHVNYAFEWYSGLPDGIRCAAVMSMPLESGVLIRIRFDRIRTWSIWDFAISRDVDRAISDAKRAGRSIVVTGQNCNSRLGLIAAILAGGESFLPLGDVLTSDQAKAFHWHVDTGTGACIVSVHAMKGAGYRRLMAIAEMPQPSRDQGDRPWLLELHVEHHGKTRVVTASP